MASSLHTPSCWRSITNPAAETSGASGMDGPKPAAAPHPETPGPLAAVIPRGSGRGPHVPPVSGTLRVIPVTGTTLPVVEGPVRVLEICLCVGGTWRAVPGIEDRPAPRPIRSCHIGLAHCFICPRSAHGEGRGEGGWPLARMEHRCGLDCASRGERYPSSK